MCDGQLSQATQTEEHRNFSFEGRLLPYVNIVSVSADARNILGGVGFAKYVPHPATKIWGQGKINHTVLTYI